MEAAPSAAGKTLLVDRREKPTRSVDTTGGASTPSRKSSKPRRESRRSERREAARASQYVELEVSSDEERRDRAKRKAMLAAAFGDSSGGGIGAAAMAAAFRRRSSCPCPDDAVDGSRSSSSDGYASTNSTAAAKTAPVTPLAPLVPRDKAFRLVRRGSDSLVNDEFYATQMQVGNFVKMGWLTKQGHAWYVSLERMRSMFSDGGADRLLVITLS